MLLIALLLQAAPALPTPAEQARIKRYFDADLLDGASARWKWPIRKSDKTYCGWVNAKNRMGAYTGWTPYWTAPSKDGGIVGGIWGNSSKVIFDVLCKEEGYDIVNPPRD